MEEPANKHISTGRWMYQEVETEEFALAVLLVEGTPERLAQLPDECWSVPQHLWLVRELRTLVDQGFDLSAPVLTRWFTRPVNKDRAERAGVPHLPGFVAEIGAKFHGIAHWDLYVSILQEARLRRGLELFAARISEKLSYGDSTADMLRWMGAQVAAFNRFSKEVGVAVPEQEASEADAGDEREPASFC